MTFLLYDYIMSKLFSYSTIHRTFFHEVGHKAHYSKHQLLTRSDEPCPWAFFLEEGLVKVAFSSGEYDQRILGYFLPGMAFAQSGVLLGRLTRRLTYEAVDDVTVYRVDAQQFADQLDTDPAFMRDFLRRSQENQLFMIERLIFASEKDLRRRIAQWLCAMVHFYSVETKNGHEIMIPMTQTIIGEFTNATRESVSKIMRDYINQGYLSVNQKKITVHNLDDLETICEQ